IESGVPLPLASVRNRRSLVALGNLADFVVTCATHPAARGEVFFVSDDEDVSTPELIRRLARAMGRPARLWPVPPALLNGAASALGKRDFAQPLLKSLRIDISKARRTLGWAPPLGLDQGLGLAVSGEQ
ncbi:MAG: hypothetical protein NUW01_13810, partial [Gemmatimonadaceae bacterium]|nr:hypothetical protein [Gemmatimonadaceae bacterium]